ncbi:CYTH domain-containing protein [Desulfospira joergensenii]|uniref:CYTH domain-containing protein n=1 Tax=Desulfospira joergensenii TaxID=53329 RepID=UPI0003B3B857|nr:CYTH domain-containing protein [Desulfospira joergensenii]
MGIEIERKFLVKKIPRDILRTKAICQGYITGRADRVVRVRMIEEARGNDQGFLTIKGKTKGSVRSEYEYGIPPGDAREMLDLLCERPLIEKERLWTRFKGFEWVIDQFFGENQGLVVAEIELESPDQAFSLPPWAGPEVTQDPRYFNSNLIRHPFSKWNKED